MNLSDNLKKIRKDNNLSQEDLAEKLGVSRQSVSKWESGVAYPEMDKVLELCKLFNLNIDELLNQNIKEVEQNKQSKSNVNKYIDSFLSYISKTVNLFSSLKFKGKINCIFEQLFIGFILVILSIILHEILDSVVRSVFSFIPEQAFFAVINVFDGVYILFAFVLIAAIMLHIFKVRYLDYYVVVDKAEEEKTSDEEEEKSDSKKEEKNNKEKVKELKRKEEKIIIRDPEHAGYKFIRGLVKVILFFIKLFAFFIGTCFAFSLVGFVACFVLSFMISKTGALFIGSIIGIIGAIIINLIILDVIINFIINRKNKKCLLLISFFASLIMIGISFGLIISSFKDFRVINEYNEKYYTTKEATYKMTDKTVIAHDYEFVESDNDDIKIVYQYANYCNLNSWNSNGIINSYQDCLDSPEKFKNFLNMINDKILADDALEVKVYTNKSNMKKLTDNYKKFIESQMQYEEYEE